MSKVTVSCQVNDSLRPDSNGSDTETRGSSILFMNRPCCKERLSTNGMKSENSRIVIKNRVTVKSPQISNGYGQEFARRMNKNGERKNIKVWKKSHCKIVNREANLDSSLSKDRQKIFAYNENWEDNCNGVADEHRVLSKEVTNIDKKNIMTSDIHNKIVQKNETKFLQNCSESKRDSAVILGETECGVVSRTLNGISYQEVEDSLMKIQSHSGNDFTFKNGDLISKQKGCVIVQSEVIDRCVVNKLDKPSDRCRDSDNDVCERNGTTNNESSTSTDFSRFKESSECCVLFPPNVWQSIDEDDLESLSKHLEKIDSLATGKNSNRKKRTLCLSDFHQIREGVTETTDDVCKNKKLRLVNADNDTNLPSTSTQKSLSLDESVQTYSRISDDCYVALDCEMVGVGERGIRSVLGRCSIVDYSGVVLYDKYVKSPEPITDFRTRWSGIRPRHMKTAEPVLKALQEIHHCLKNKIVIGHSIKNDFGVLDLHPHRYLVRDTAKCRLLLDMACKEDNSCRGNGLKNLTKILLSKEIQVGNKGHDSVEDALATLELFKLVREEWEKQLFQHWSKEGLRVDEFITRLNKKEEDVRDSKGCYITDFKNIGRVGILVTNSCKNNRDVGNYDKKQINDNNNHVDKDNSQQWQFHEDYLSDQFWPDS